MQYFIGMILIDKISETQNIILSLSQMSAAKTFVLEATHQFTGKTFQIPLKENLSRFRDRYDDFLIETPDIPLGMYRIRALDGDAVVYSGTMKVVDTGRPALEYVQPNSGDSDFVAYIPDNN